MSKATVFEFQVAISSVRDQLIDLSAHFFDLFIIMVNMPTSKPHANFKIFSQNAQNITLSPKVIVVRDSRRNHFMPK